MRLKPIFLISLILLMVPSASAAFWDAPIEKLSDSADRLQNTVANMFQVIAKFVRNLELLWFHIYFIIVALVFFGLIALMITLPVKIWPRVQEMIKLWRKVVNYFN